jgi:Zn-dependent protease
MPQQQSVGGLRLFKALGVTVYLHWTWFIVAALEVQWGRELFGSVQWAAVAYLLLFAIVLLHEFGHALACRSVGGEAERIILWPLGGAAIVKPPPRPGALLWSIAAGPLVNVIILAISIPLMVHYWHDALRLASLSPLGKLIVVGLFWQNLILLVFNLLPIYPLDGGQIVRALLWFVIGRASSLAVAAWIGLVVSGLGCVAALATSNWWLALIAAFAAFQSWAGVARSKRLREATSAPHYMGVACPSCGAAPPAGPFWRCECGQPFDPFQTGAVCPACGRAHAQTACPECDRRAPLARWQSPLPLPPITPAGPPLA